MAVASSRYEADINNAKDRLEVDAKEGEASDKENTKLATECRDQVMTVARERYEADEKAPREIIRLMKRLGTCGRKCEQCLISRLVDWAN